MRLTKIIAGAVLIALNVATSHAGGNDILAVDSNAPESPVERYSLMGAIKNGYLDANLTVAQVAEHGDFGLGGFAGFSGEMIMLDGTVYKVPWDGVARIADDADRITYAELTKFAPNRVFQSTNETKEALLKRIGAAVNNPNIFVSVRIDGRFKRTRFRTVFEQREPFPKPICAKNIDHVFDTDAVSGTVLGFVQPSFVKGGIDYPGSHLHFLTDSKAIGGHVYDFLVESGTVYVGTHHVFTINLPTTSRFAGADVDSDFPCPPQN